VGLKGNAFEQMFPGQEVPEDMKVSTDWQPEIISMYRVSPQVST